ncbi:uncharacterized protein [Leptinotarsa decemlineata]|uniref:uncharacterized protein n=1 Tax=Leptinotarsa decemlineata TaxID=7539 RepID=UPI000C2520F0|nr:uncharacterized protein LOC111504490 [Leptinotarsa decemlineata]
MERNTQPASSHSGMLTGKNGILLELCVLLMKEANLKGKRRAAITGITNIDVMPDARTSFRSGATLGMAMALAMEAEPIVPLAEVIETNINDTQKKKLVGSISCFFTKIELKDAAEAMDILAKDEQLKATVLTRIRSHCIQELNYNLH